MGILIAAAAAGLLYARYLRPRQLSWGATANEVARRLPGDDLVPKPTFNATRAITIAASPEQIWPWLVQTGVNRAGWYSYDLRLITRVRSRYRWRPPSIAFSLLLEFGDIWMMRKMLLTLRERAEGTRSRSS